MLDGVVTARIVDAATAEYEIDDGPKKFARSIADRALKRTAGTFALGGSAEPVEDGGDRTEVPDLLDATAFETALIERLNTELSVAGIAVESAELGGIKYAPEIAEAMMQVERAKVTIQARELLVDAAVGIVDDALAKLKERLEGEGTGSITLDDQAAASIAHDLLVVLVGGESPTAVVQVGANS